MEQKKAEKVYARFGTQARRDWKRAGRKTVRSHYWPSVLLCLVAAFLGTEFTGSLDVLHLTQQKWDTISNFLASFGRPGAAANSRGVFALAVNKIADGSLQDIVNNTVMSLAGSSEWGQTIAIAVSSLVSAIYWVLITNTFAVILRRLFMEMRVYEEVPPYRALYLHSAHCWGRTSLAQLRAAVQLALWWLTIVGGVIKTFSYYLCSFILAENPTMKGKDAIALSRKMMNGHKWECFLMELSFVPWHLLSMATFGLTDLFYASAYITATRCEFYAAVRAQVKAEGEAEALRDTYLFERATAKTLRRAYNDLGKPVEKLPERVYGNRVSHFFGEYLGVTLFVNPQDVAREKIQDREYRLRYMRRCEQGLSYPIRLSPLLQYEHKDREPALFTRKYPVTTLVLLFFLFSTIGWCWEVVLHLVTAGTFVNRGVLHGPWLPIYGTGGVLVLLALYKLRDRPWLEFIATIVVCGIVEYFTAYYLETVYDRRWWDYAGYFLNLHGRICAEGLLVFGLGGMAVVYGVAPLFDNLLHKVKRSALIALCVALVALFCVDQVYSHFYPNEGEGITDEVVYKVNDARVSPDGEAFV
mgnify:FL=1